jgi:tetratricopeptide (TPR) repeat protein
LVFIELGTLRNAQLLQEPIKTLCAAIELHGAIRLLHEFSDGFSETRVVLGEIRSGPDDLQPFRLVFKVGATDVLRDEVHRYRDFTAHARASAAFVPIWKADLTLEALPPDGSLGAIAYGHASDVLGAQNCVAFKSVFRECIRGERAVPAVEGMIESIARIIGSLYGEPTRCFAQEVALYYLEHWAPDYQVAADHLVDSDSYPLLTLQRLNPEYFRSVDPSIGAVLRKEAESPVNDGPIDIVLPRCTVAKVRRNRLVAWVNSPDDLSLHIDTRELPPTSYTKFSKGSTISLWVPRRMSRYDFYLRHVRLALPSLDVEAPFFHVGPLCLHNPLKHFSAPLVTATKPPAFTFMVPGHGDLHPDNVLIAGTSPVIIDYGKSVTRIPIGVDAARFLGGLVRDVLAEELSFEDLAIVLAETFGLGSFLKEPDSPASRAIYLLRLIIENLVPANVPELQTLWPVHLYGYAWIGLKWPHGSPESYRACFLLAGMALQSLLGASPAADQNPSAAPSSGGEGKSVHPITEMPPIKPERAAEILILVARFDGSADYDPTVRIYTTLSDLILETLGSLARVERIEEVISSRKDAVAMAERYRASMIVWGTFDNMGVSPRYEVTRDSLVIKRSMIQLDQATRHQLSERFEPYITQNLAAEVSFLSLKAVAEMCLLNLNYEAAIKVFNRALSLIPDRERAQKLGAIEMYQGLASVYFALTLDREAMEANDKARELDRDDLSTELQGLQVRSRIEKRSSIQQLEEFKRLLRARLEATTEGSEESQALRAVLTKLEPIHTSADLRKMIVSVERRVLAASPMSNKQFEKDVMIHLQRALELIRADKFQKAMTEIRSALRLNPRCVEAITMRAGVLAVTDHVDEPLKELQKAEKLNPNPA